MSLANLVRWRGAHRPVSTVTGPLPSRVNAAYSQPSVSSPPACGAIDQLSGAVCTIPAHSTRLHRDNTDPATALEWWDDEWTAHRGKPWAAPTLRLIGATK